MMTKAEILKELKNWRNSEFILSKHEDSSDYLYHKGLYLAYNHAIELIDRLEDPDFSYLHTIIYKLVEIVAKEQEKQ